VACFFVASAMSACCECRISTPACTRRALPTRLGAGLILLGLMLQAVGRLITRQVAVDPAFLWFTSPTATHALIKAALADPENPRPLRIRSCMRNLS
jgi:hypothetical protein